MSHYMAVALHVGIGYYMHVIGPLHAYYMPCNHYMVVSCNRAYYIHVMESVKALRLPTKRRTFCSASSLDFMKYTALKREWSSTTTSMYR